MPVIVKDYTWSETINEVVIIVPLKGANPSKADNFSSDDYVKVRAYNYAIACFPSPRGANTESGVHGGEVITDY